jgi:hypothetical protein
MNAARRKMLVADVREMQHYPLGCRVIESRSAWNEFPEIAGRKFNPRTFVALLGALR